MLLHANAECSNFFLSLAGNVTIYFPRYFFQLSFFCPQSQPCARLILLPSALLALLHETQPRQTMMEVGICQAQSEVRYLKSSKYDINLE